MSLTEGLTEFAPVKLEKDKKMGNTLGNRYITNVDLRGTNSLGVMFLHGCAKLVMPECTGTTATAVS